MSDMKYLAIVGATVAAFAFSSVWYIVFAKQRAKLSSAAATEARPPRWMMPVELLRTLVLALVLAGLTSQLRIADGPSAVKLAFALWIGFPLILLSGSVIYEKVPWKLAAIHVGDWLGKLLVIAMVVSLWR
jgi:Protein of unknown function (DUF1761)